MTELAYLAAAVAFIFGLKQLSHPRTARRGNMLASAGMLLAIVVTLVSQDIVNWGAILAGVVVGAAIGAVWARRVAMTGMPEMVAALNGFGGVASALVAGAELIAISDPELLRLDVQLTMLFALTIGTATFSGSIAAFGKLRELIPGRAIVYPGQRVVSVGITALLLAAVGVAIVGTNTLGYLVAAAVALTIGVLMVLPIGGADMPVVVSMLNSLSGLAAAGTGFVIGNSALIIGGSLVGAAGFILTVQMCDAMNRSLFNVLFGAFGSAEQALEVAATGDRNVRSATSDDVAIALAYAEHVMIVPGYGLAVAQAQHDVGKLARALEERGVAVDYAIHPVAGRMPGHMNVLLAEADVDYERLLDLDDANAALARTDVALVLGANDVVNPSARDDVGSPIFGMPIIEVDRATTVVVIKRSLSPGYAGVDNPLFYADGTMMYFGDAGDAIQAITSATALL